MSAGKYEQLRELTLALQAASAELARTLPIVNCGALEDGEQCLVMRADGEYCAACARWHELEAVRWKRQWLAATLAERDPAGYRQDMIDAGRGHLVDNQAWSMFQRQQGER